MTRVGCNIEIQINNNAAKFELIIISRLKRYSKHIVKWKLADNPFNLYPINLYQIER